MKKLLLVVGLVVLFFAQSSYAANITTTKGNYSGLTWDRVEHDGSYGHSHWIAIKKQKKVELRFYIFDEDDFEQKDCFDFSSQTYFNNTLCEEMNFIITTYMKNKQENINQIKKFIDIVVKDLCENPQVIYTSKIHKKLLGGMDNGRFTVKCPKVVAYNKSIQEEKILAEQEAIRIEQEAEAQEQVDAQQKKMETCEAYGFEKGSEPFGQCIFKLMELDLEYAKLENERLRLQAQAEQAELNNQAALAQSLAAQAQASNRDKALRIQQFGLAMQGIANSFQTPSSMANPKITCHNFGNQMKCW